MKAKLIKIIAATALTTALFITPASACPVSNFLNKLFHVNGQPAPAQTGSARTIK